MRSRIYLSFPALLALLGNAPAGAGTLTSATWTQTVSPLFGVGLGLSRSAAQLGAIGSSTPTSVSVGLSFPAFATSFFVPETAKVPLDRHFAFQQGGAQSLTATPGMAGGAPGIPGSAVVKNANHPTMGVNQSSFMVGNVTLLNVPLNVGQAGQFTNTYLLLGLNVVLTVDFFAWTPGTLTFTGLTYKLAPLPDVIAMGSFDLTGDGSGTVTLVSPSRITIRSSVLHEHSVLTLATLKLTFVPEPAALLLLAACAAALSLRGARRRR